MVESRDGGDASWLARFLNRIMIFASLKIFSFFGEAKFADFRLTVDAQVVCGSRVRLGR
jgi:hypothetical protein